MLDVPYQRKTARWYNRWCHSLGGLPLKRTRGICAHGWIRRRELRIRCRKRGGRRSTTATDQLTASAQADLTTMSDHNDARRSRMTADGTGVSVPAHGRFPTRRTYLTSEGSAAVRSRLRWGPLGDHTPCTHPDNRHLGTPTAPPPEPD